MVLRKITIDNSVRYIPTTAKTKEIKPKTIKAGSLPRKQNKNVSQNTKKILRNVAANGFGHNIKKVFEQCWYYKWIMNYYYY